MQQKDIQFFNNLIKGYFGKCDTQIEAVGDKNGYYVSNVKYHTQDKAWLRAYIFNRVYTDFNTQSQVIFDIHSYVASEFFDKLVADYTNHIVDSYTKKILKGLKKDSLKNIEPQRRAGVVCELIVSYLQKNLNIAREISVERLRQKQESIKKIVEYIMQDNKITNDLIERY